MSTTLAPNHLAGRRVGHGRFELVSLLGEGSYGAVYRALLHRGGAKEPRLCAIKVLRTTHRESSLLCQRRELELHRRVSACKGIVTLYETFKEGPYQYMVMRLCTNRDLSYWISKKRYLGNDTGIKEVFMQVLDAVDYCHSHSVFHRDIKPQNILLCEGGNKALLSDFGLATGNHISTEKRTGSPWYMSPECWGALSWSRSYATAPNDIWSLGILLINLTCRKAPWTHANLDDATFCEFVKRPYMLRFFVPLSPEIHDILLRVFAIKPERRINIKDFKAAIQSVKSFGIPIERHTEYYIYQHAVWRAAAFPTLSRPLVLAPSHCDRGHAITRPLGCAKVDSRPYPPSSNDTQVALAKKQVHRKTQIYPPMVHSNSLTLQMQGIPDSLSKARVLEINIDVPLQKHTAGSPVDSWQSILNAMNAW